MRYVREEPYLEGLEALHVALVHDVEFGIRGEGLPLPQHRLPLLEGLRGKAVRNHRTVLSPCKQQHALLVAACSEGSQAADAATRESWPSVATVVLHL
jgi:hypothetical protein